MTKNCLIYETLNDVKSMDVQKSKDGLMHLSGVFGVCGVRNNNQRVYEHNNYAKMVENMQERIKKAPIPGELEHPQTMNITLENISHRIDSIKIDENGVVSGEITLLDTPKGKIAQAIVEGGLPLFISSRAQGQVNPKNGVVTLESLATYDLVGTPGFSQAEMHLNESLIAESLSDNVFYITEKENNENNENNLEDMEMQQILEKFEALENQINELKEQNEELQAQLESKQDIDLEKLANGIQRWIVEEYSPEVQNWITEEYQENLLEESMNEVKNYVKESLAPSIEKWIVEEYSPEVEKWTTTEFAQGIQQWIVEEYAPEVEKWITESYGEQVANKINEAIETKVSQMISEKINESKNDNIQSIKDTLTMLESMEPNKPVYKRTLVNEDAPKYIVEMPEDVRVKYNMASQEVKESIARRAKLYNFVNEGAVEAFWKNIDFENIKPSKSVYEGLNDIVNERERNIRASFRRNRF
jgi:hypothetical protein